MYTDYLIKKFFFGLLLVTQLFMTGCSLYHTSIITEASTLPLPSDFSLYQAPSETNDTFQVIAHALGQVDGRLQTNSKEAFLNSVEKDYTLLEADFQHTSDGVLVVRHDFLEDSYYNLEQAVNGDTSMTLDEYVSQKINFKYTPLTAKDLLELMDLYPAISIVTDTKHTSTEQVEKDFTSLIQLANALEKPYLLDRFIIQLYNKEMYEVVNNLYPFKDYILTTYQLAPGTEADLAAFCAAHGIGALTLPAPRLNPSVVQTIKSYGINVYTHTLNRLSDLQHYYRMGIDGVYTDIITPNDIQYIIP